MNGRFATTALASLLGFGLLVTGCDQNEEPTVEREALLFVDGEPVFSLDEVPDSTLLLMSEVLQGQHEHRVAAESATDDLSFRRQCVADCGDHMMSISGNCACEDGVGCVSIDDGIFYNVNCDGSGGAQVLE